MQDLYIKIVRDLIVELTPNLFTHKGLNFIESILCTQCENFSKGLTNS